MSNQDRLLSDEVNKIRDGFAIWMKRNMGGRHIGGTSYSPEEFTDKILDLINTQKRLYAESVIGKNEPHIIVDNGVAIDSCDSYKTQSEADCNCPAGERNQLRAEQRARIK